MRWRLLLRPARLVLVLLAVTMASFAMISALPGDAVDSVLSPNASASAHAEARADLHLDDPLPVRYVAWLGDVVHGDLGRSYRTNQPVSEAILERLPLTIELVVLSQLLALLVAVPMAILSATRPGSLLDRSLTAMTLAMFAAPAYLVAVLVIAVFAVRLGWFPTGGFVRLRDDPLRHLQSLVLPAVALGVQEVAMYMRMLRSDLGTVLEQDYIAFARAKGVPSARVLFRHALRPSSTGVLSLTGVVVGRLLAGSVLVELIFGLPGLGRYTIDSVDSRDFLAVQGSILVLTVAFVVINQIVDVAHELIDPRIRARS